MTNILETRIANKLDIASGSYSDKGIRKENEDSLLVLKDTLIPTFIVADGAGGYSFGKETSNLAVAAFKEEISKLNNTNIGYISKLINKKYEQVNEYIFTKASKLGKRMMTTFSMVNIIENQLLISNLGDTIIYKIDKQEISIISEPHSLAWEQYKNKSITYEQYLNHPKKNIITRALGGTQEANPYFSTMFYKDKDIYIICTDGIYNFVPQDELLLRFNSGVHTSETLELCCRDIGNEVLKRNGNDNLTIVAFQIFIS